MTYWRKDSKLIVDTMGRPIRCNTCPCESEPGEVCMPCCASAANQWIVTLPSGFANGPNCNRCASLSGASFLLTHASSCRWTYEEPDFCPSCIEIDFNLSISFRLTSDLTNRCVATLQLILFGPDDAPCRGDIVTWQKVHTPPATFSCGGSNSLPFVSAITDGPACNAYPSGAATVEPA